MAGLLVTTTQTSVDRERHRAVVSLLVMDTAGKVEKDLSLANFTVQHGVNKVANLTVAQHGAYEREVTGFYTLSFTLDATLLSTDTTAIQREVLVTVSTKDGRTGQTSVRL
jgi:hypothetical protein